MQARTFFRVMIDNLLFNNVFFKTLSSLVKFCNEQQYFSQKTIVSQKTLPINKVPVENSVYRTHFIFNSSQNNGTKF